MKKALKITGIVLLVIILLMIILPFFFEDQVAEIVKEQANKKIDATLNFGDVGLNMFSHFPDFTLSIDDITIVNKAPFEGDTLLSAGSFHATVDIWEAVFGGNIVIKGLSLENPDIFIYVLEDSTANYNIYTADTTAAEDTSESEFNVALNYYSVSDANIAYVDQTSNLAVAVKNLNHSGSGDFTQDEFNINTNTTIDQLTLTRGGITYLNEVNASLDMILRANMPEKTFTLDDNELRINNLALRFEGSVQNKEEEMVINLKFNTPENDFKDLISLIPAVYAQNFDKLEASGKLSFNGIVNGAYRENHLPEFNLTMQVNNGMFRYPDLPTAVNDVNLDLTVDNPGGAADNTVINVKQLHWELGNEPFDAKILIKQPESGPFVDASMNGKINLEQLNNAVHLEDIRKLEGIITADFSMSGNLANVKNKQYENINASGNISASNIIYAGTDSQQEIRISDAALNLNPKSFRLSRFNMSMGKSNLNATGELNNMVSYLLSDGILNGNLKVTSDYFNVNPFMEKAEDGAESESDTTKLEAVELPENINFTVSANFKELVYDNLTMKNVNGTITLKDQRLNLNNLSANLLGGSFTANGYYETRGEVPGISFSMNINSFNIQDTYESFMTVKQFVPLAEYMNGSFGGKLSLTSELGDDMLPVWETFNSSGNLNIPKAEIKGFKPFQLVGDKLKISELSNPELNNVNTSYKIESGRFHISPVDYKISNYDVTFFGSNGIDRSIDYTMGVNIPAGNIKTSVNQAVSNLLKKDVNLITSNNVKVNVNIDGTISSPEISVGGGEIAEQAKEQVQEAVKEEVKKQVEEKKEEVKKQVEEKADTLKKELKKKAEEKIKDLFKKKF